MKTLFLSAALFVCVAGAFAQDYPDLSANYYLWKPDGSKLTSEIKDGKKVALTDAEGRITLKYQLGGMQGGGFLSPSWSTESGCRDQQNFTSVRFCTNGPTTYGWGRQLIEVEQGILVIGDMNYNFAPSGECTQVSIEGVNAILFRDESKKNSVSIPAVKAKCNELLEQMCKVTKDKNAQKKDLRGLANLSGGAPDFSASKKIDGTYYTYKNPDGIGDMIYGDCKSAEITDAGDHIEINSKFMGLKKIKVLFNSSKQLVDIEKAGGHKILMSDASASQYKISDTYLVEIEEGILVLACQIETTFRYESDCKASANGISYVFFKDKSKCSDIALGEIKTKFKQILSDMCKAYQKTLPPPSSSVAVFLPEAKNKETALEKPAFDEILAYTKRMGWKETIISSYIVSENWTPFTKKEFINNSYIDVVKYRQKYAIVFFKTDKGIYKSQGVSISQNIVAGDYSGKNFNTAVYCSGVLDGVPGSGWNIQIVKEADAMKYKK